MSREINALLPSVATKAWQFLEELSAADIDVIVTCTWRDPEEQDRLFSLGRSTPGKKITNARAWQSWHQYRRALDLVPVRNGKPVWTTTGADGELWQKIGEIGERCGFEWAGRWQRFREYPHFQITDGLTFEQARKQL